ncbi:hypothetical protein F511_36655 [Dorcoceras hygrometricum]|uniref:Uncharacterized protein n=1 Tax=Dorcoceras hygrometricum TaxID=472368 RepID=A0A2Z7C844_9LAMI|nr:hypothetical protein F511_36655 [Dorcoceras hygrometricum]
MLRSWAVHRAEGWSCRDSWSGLVGPGSYLCWGTATDPDHASRRGSGRTKIGPGDDQYNSIIKSIYDIHRFGPFNPYIPIRSTTIGKSRVAKDPIAMHTSWRSNSDIVSVTRSKNQNRGVEIAGRRHVRWHPLFSRKRMRATYALAAQGRSTLCAMVGRSLRTTLRDLAGHCRNAGRLLHALVLRCRAARGAAVGRTKRAMLGDVWRRSCESWPGAVERCCAAEVRCCARRRALPPRFFMVLVPPAGRRSGESPAMS